jgi:hypothetical protein
MPDAAQAGKPFLETRSAACVAVMTSVIAFAFLRSSAADSSRR